MAEVNIKIPCWYYDGCNFRLDNPDCRKTCYRYLKMNYLIVNCGKPDASMYLKELIPLEIDQEPFKRLGQIKDDIVNFVEESKNLYIGSYDIQVGKTTWSLKLMYKFFDRIWGLTPFETRGYFVYVPEFLSNCTSFQYRETPEFKEIDRALKTADIVIWDEITSEVLSEADRKILNMYISKRIQDGKTNIFNGLYYENFEEMLGKTLSARIKMSEQVILNATSEAVKALIKSKSK